MPSTFSARSTARDERLLEGVIANMPMFRDVDCSGVGQIASLARIQYCHPGALIARQGEPLPGIIAVAYGLAKLALPRRKGDEKVLGFLGANETFGAASVLLDRPCPLNIVALTDSMLAVLPARPLLRLLEFDPKFARNLTKDLAGSVLGMVSEFEASVQCSAVQRLASYLGSLARPAQAAQGETVRLPASKTQIAARIGITKETMSRLLRGLAERGLISVSGREILILDRPGLAQIAA